MLATSGRLMTAVMLVGLFVSGCGGRERVERVIVVVTATPAPGAKAAEVKAGPEVTWTPEPLEPTAAVTGTVFEVAFPTRRPTIDASAIPNMDRPRGPTPGSRTEQLAGCLTYSIEPTAQPGVSGNVATRVRVRARNSCNLWIPVNDSRFEIISISNASGGTVGRETGMFQEPIPPLSSNVETFVAIDCPSNLPGGCRYTAAVWWAAGGGRRPD